MTLFARVRVHRGWWGIIMPLLVMMLAPPAASQQRGPQAGRKASVSPKRPAREQPRDGLWHTVRPGESLWTVARRHGVTAEMLARANRVEIGHRIRVGQALIIPTAAIAPGSQEPPSPAEIDLGPPPEVGQIGFSWPIPAAVASPFGPRGRAWHGGIDIRADRGTTIRAAAPGMVIASGWESGYGRVIKIWHHFDFMTVYAHNHENLVRVGDWIDRSQVIGTVGNTGRSTAAHLHFEIRLAGRKYDPLFWLPPAGSVDVARSGTQAVAAP